MTHKRERERERRLITSSEEKIARVVRSYINREKWQPNIERGFTCPTKETYHGHSPFIPTQKMLDQAKGKFD